MAKNYSGPPQRGGGYADRSRELGLSDGPAPEISINEIRLDPLPPELFSGIAKKAAEQIAAAGRGTTNKSTQLRKFYDELTMWSEKVQREHGSEKRKKTFDDILPFLKMMNAKVAYANGRRHVDDCFSRMFSDVVNQIKTPNDLKHAKLFMEAFMGFYKAQEISRS